MLTLTVFLIIFSVLDPQEEDRRREFKVWAYDEESFVRVLASDLFQSLGLIGNFTSVSIIEAFDKLATDEEASCDQRRQQPAQPPKSTKSKTSETVPTTTSDVSGTPNPQIKAIKDQIDPSNQAQIAIKPETKKGSNGRSRSDPDNRKVPADKESNGFSMPKITQVLVNISLIPGTGWGHLGYEVLFGLLDEADETAVEPIFVGDVHPDALHSSSPHAASLPALLQSHRAASAALLAAGASRLPYPAVHATDHFYFDRPRAVGTPNVALVFFDSFNFTPPLVAAAAASFDAVVAGSAWNAQVLRESGLAVPVHLIRQASPAHIAPRHAPRGRRTQSAACPPRASPPIRARLTPPLLALRARLFRASTSAAFSRRPTGRRRRPPGPLRRMRAGGPENWRAGSWSSPVASSSSARRRCACACACVRACARARARERRVGVRAGCGGA